MSVRTIIDPDEFRQSIKYKLMTFFDVDNHATNLEKGIYNWAVKEANNKKVVKKWDNQFFVRIYIDHLKSVYFNLKANIF